MEKKEKLYKNWSIRELEDNLKDVINSLTKEDLLIYITDTMVFAEEHIAELDKAREEGYRGGLEEAQTLLEEEFDYWEEKEILYKLDGLDEAIVTISNELDKLKDNK